MQTRGVTPTNTDQRGLKVEVEDHVYYCDTNSSKKIKALSYKAAQKILENYI